MKTRFPAIRSKQVTLDNGQHTVTLTVQRPPLLFNDMLNRAFPSLEQGADADQTYRLLLRVVLIAAEGIRHTEDLPERPGAHDGESAWQDHAEMLAQTFSEAGFTDHHINVLAHTAQDLVLEKVEGRTGLAQELADAGNA